MKKSMLEWGEGGANCVAVTISAMIFLLVAVSPANGEILINGGQDNGGLTIDGNYGIAPGENVDTVVVNSGDLNNDGTVTDAEVNNGRYSGYGDTGDTKSLYVGNGGTLCFYYGIIENLTFADGGKLEFFDDFQNDDTGPFPNDDIKAQVVNFNKVNIGNVNLENATIYLYHGRVLASDFRIDLASFFNFIGEGGFVEDSNWEKIKYVGAIQGKGNIEFELTSLGNGWFGRPAPNPTPEPATVLFFGLGLAGLGLVRRRSRYGEWLPTF